MSFPAAAGYTQFPNGNWSPVIYSKKAQIAFRKVSVVQAISNTDYFGEIADYGDTVKIIKEPDITVSSYQRGLPTATQSLVDNALTLVVDHANYFQFDVDDIEKKQSHINWESLAADRAGYKLRDTFDAEVLTFTTTQITAGNTTGSAAAPQVLNYSGSAGVITPLNMLARMARQMDQANIPFEDRWFLADPVFYELLQDENSKLLNWLNSQDKDSILRNGKVTEGKIRGFDLYMSNNLPSGGTGANGTGANNFGWIIAGHKSALATAEQINKVESFRSQTTFADVVRGLHMYGRSVLRPEALMAAVYNTAATE